MSSAQKIIIVSSVIFAGLLVYTRFARALTVDQNGNVIVEHLYGPASTAARQGGQVLSEKTEKTETTATAGAKAQEKKNETKSEEGGRTRTDVFEGGTKLHFERSGDRTSVKIEDEKGEEMELPEGMEGEVLEIKEKADKNQIKVRAAGNEFLVEKDKVSAATKLPLSVNLKTNELTVTTPAGEKVVAVLPDQAVKNMLAQNVIDQTEGATAGQNVGKVATQEGTTPETEIKLTTTREGVLAYEIPGTKKKRFLGFLPVSISKTAVVSAETGALIQTQESLISQALDLLSF